MRGRQFASAPALLLLPPLLHENYRTIRFLCELASGLAEQGIDCLRFSHTGAGDSEGAGGEADLDMVAADVAAAARTLAGYSNAGRLAVLAFRSAALALPRWLDAGGRCDLVVGWDPVLDGAAWLRDRWAEDATKRATIRPEADMDCSDDTDLMGLDVSPRMLEDIGQARWNPAQLPADVATWQVLYAGQAPAAGVRRRFELPATVPPFGEGVLMDASLLFSSPLQRTVRELGSALVASA
jgi:alpha-beta hydrolase superfamily lysophospholipase